MTHNNLGAFSADRPIDQPKDDRLGYAPFARNLAKSISTMSPPEGLVLAIHGAWGSGKTSALNLVIHYLTEMPSEDQPIVVPFNPWWFSGHEDLARQFFAQLQSALDIRDAISRETRTKISQYADIASEIPVPGFSFGGKLIAYISRPETENMAKLKAEVAEELAKLPTRILVVIDDIDRLTADEIRQLFRVIKAVADFPNVIYLLAFDWNVVKCAVEDDQAKISGEDYLEKIVQVSFELPLPDKIALRDLLFENLSAILSRMSSDSLPQIYWENVYYRGIDHFIATPRDVVRFTNTVSVTYPTVEGEVNIVDFLAIEALRVFCPVAYHAVRGNPLAFLKADVPGFASHVIEDLEGFHNSWLRQIQEQDTEPVKQLLAQIFPMVSAIWYKREFDASWVLSWRKNNRICTQEFFPIYFRLGVPEGSISNAEMEVMLELASDSEAFSQKLLALAEDKRPDGTTRVYVFFERLRDYTEEIPIENIGPMVRALYDIGDQLPEIEQRQVLQPDVGNAGRIFFTVDRLLLRIQELERFKVLKGAIETSNSIWTIIYMVTAYGDQHGKYGGPERPEEEKRISLEHIEELEQITLEKIRKAADDGSLAATPKLKGVLNTWREWVGDEDVISYVSELISDNEGLKDFLGNVLSQRFIQGWGDVAGKTYWELDQEWLEEILEPSEILDRVKQIAQDDQLTQMQAIAVQKFIEAFDYDGKTGDAVEVTT